MKPFIKKIITISTVSCISWFSVQSQAAEEYNLTIVEIQQCIPKAECIELNKPIKDEIINFYKNINININWKVEKLVLEEELVINYDQINYERDIWKLNKTLINNLGNKIQDKIVILTANLNNDFKETDGVLGIAFPTIDLILVKNQTVQEVNKNYSAYVIKHEIGHILGLVHSDTGECNLMDSYMVDNYYICEDLTEDQINIMKNNIQKRNVYN